MLLKRCNTGVNTRIARSFQLKICRGLASSHSAKTVQRVKSARSIDDQFGVLGGRWGWLGPGPPPHLGSLSLTAGARARTPLPCKSEQGDAEREPHAAAAATAPSPRTPTQNSNHTECRLKILHGAFPPSASARFAASRSAASTCSDWRPFLYLSHFDGCFAYFVAHFSKFFSRRSGRGETSCSPCTT